MRTSRMGVVGKGLALAVALGISGCGGGSGQEASPGAGGSGTPTPPTNPTTPPADPKPLTGIQDFKLSGSVKDDAALKGARVTAFNTSGGVCGTAKTNDSGDYTIEGKCAFPMLVAADIPDANDPTGEAEEGEGRKLVGVLPVIMQKGESLELHLNPMSTAVTALMAGEIPEPGSSTPTTSLGKERMTQALDKLKSVTDSLATKLGIEKPDLGKGASGDGTALGDLLKMAQITFERIASTKQSVIRFHVVTEHRPIAVVHTDGRAIQDAVIDGGLGALPDDVDGQRLKEGLSTVKALGTELKGSVWNLGTMLDGCYLHNGRTNLAALMDSDGGWPAGSDSSVENVRVLRINTYTDQDNETLEKRNEGPATLAYVAFDFRNAQGLKQRGYTWAILGKQSVNGCEAGRAAGWSILGNQRRAYSRVTTYALHQVMYSQAFGTRRDTFGSGLEVVLDQPASGAGFTHALISGPGITGDGAVFVYADGSFLLSQDTLLSIRQLANQPGTDDGSVYAQLLAKVRETKSVLFANDAAAMAVTDAFYDRQNTYTVRLFKGYKDLFPTLTYRDVLPKRPYLPSKLKADLFGTVGVNVDQLVQSLQLGSPVQVNWSLPPDGRGIAVKARRAWLSRLNCNKPPEWPKCSSRSDQFNEWAVAPEYFFDGKTAATVLSPWAAKDGVLTFKGIVRVESVDSLNRPMESAVGMDYTR